MRKGMGGVCALVALLCGAAPATAAEIKAGAAGVDATWHVGASAGQYSSTKIDGVDPQADPFDPHVHQIKNKPSYGVQSRLTARAIVIQSGSTKFAIVKTDLYIPQDLLWRRAAQILEARGTGIGKHNLMHVVTHDHSSPYYTSSAWGAWAFQDVLDVRSYAYYARAIADAVTAANKKLVPVRIGASTVKLGGPNRSSTGPAKGNPDNTPAGFPDSYTDRDLMLLRIDDVSNPSDPKPLANFLNWAMHPEGLSGNDLISADYVGALERRLDRQTGALTVFSQGSVGTSEDERNSYHSIHDRIWLDHREYGQNELAAKLIADPVLSMWDQIGDGGGRVPFFTDAPVKFEDRWFPGPLSHPYPAVSSCRTEIAMNGNPQLPIVGLPDCTGPGNLPVSPNSLGIGEDELKALGVPVPDNYGAPSYTGLEEDLSVHLQAFRLGDILFTACSCEQWVEQSENIETRTDRVAGNEFAGFDWATYRGLEQEPGADGIRTECYELRPFDGSRWSCDNLASAQTVPCFDEAGGTVSCPDPSRECLLKGLEFTNTCRGTPFDGRVSIAKSDFEQMKAQVRNCANGWNAPEYLPYAESEPLDPKAIKGNFSCDDTEKNAGYGYALTVPIGMANDYNGYIASYREYQRGDHYRKALTGWGPHSSDYMASRLVAMGRQMNGAPDVQEQLGDDGDSPLIDTKTPIDQAHNDVRAQALGALADLAHDRYEDIVPDDVPAGAVKQPTDTQRFDAALFTWTGGNNFTDNPVVRVQRLVDGEWTDYAEQLGGEVVTTVKFPNGLIEGVTAMLAGHRYEWTAHFEPFVSTYDLGDRPRATPAGTYRFVVKGKRREGRATVPYSLTSSEFRVAPWTGVTVEDIRLDADGRVSFRSGPRHEVPVPGGNPATATIGPIDYPDSYASKPGRARFIRHQRTVVRDPGAPGDPSRFEWFCFTCSFRPWLDAAEARTATVTFASASGSEQVPATLGGDGRWRTSQTLADGQAAYVCPGGLRDEWGNTNGELSAAVGSTDVALSCAPFEPVATPNAGNGLRVAAVTDEALGLPARPRGKRCGTRHVRLRVRSPRRRVKMRSAVVYVNGVRKHRLTGRKLRRVVKLGIPREGALVTVRIKGSDRKTYTAKRRYRGC